MNPYETIALPWYLIFLVLLGVFALLVIFTALFPRGGRDLGRGTKRAPNATPRENAEADKESINEVP
jgi:Sec-independent protein translocase protein TatA